jgi:predicted O-methyltransferase YrrM
MTLNEFEIEAEVNKVFHELNPQDITALIYLGVGVPTYGRIFQIGALYGGSAIALGLASGAFSVIVDNFSYTPEAGPEKSTEEVLHRNLELAGVTAEIRNMDSMDLTAPEKEFDLCFLDGNHDYEYIAHDLETIGPSCRVVALHDWDDPRFPGVMQAAKEFLARHPKYYFSYALGHVGVLRRS